MICTYDIISAIIATIMIYFTNDSSINHFNNPENNRYEDILDSFGSRFVKPMERDIISKQFKESYNIPANEPITYDDFCFAVSKDPELTEKVIKRNKAYVSNRKKSNPNVSHGFNRSEVIYQNRQINALISANNIKKEVITTEEF